MAKQQYTATEVADALRQERGIVSRAARRLHCDGDTIYNYVKRYPTVDAAMTEARRGIVDLAEDGLVAALEAREAWAIGLTLRTLGKDRGYAERHEVGGPNGQDLTFTLTLDRPSGMGMDDGDR